jgi:hypothetical protein
VLFCAGEYDKALMPVFLKIEALGHPAKDANGHNAED